MHYKTIRIILVGIAIVSIAVSIMLFNPYIMIVATAALVCEKVITYKKTKVNTFKENYNEMFGFIKNKNLRLFIAILLFYLTFETAFFIVKKSFFTVAIILKIIALLN
ncbi:MAG: hypothetical protein FWG20_07455 [Candidatus Cloacimonetes bacterium]|nr:hypothetical protein [Candidatus Cloacimonadota bacterium]